MTRYQVGDIVRIVERGDGLTSWKEFICKVERIDSEYPVLPYFLRILDEEGNVTDLASYWDEDGLELISPAASSSLPAFMELFE